METTISQEYDTSLKGNIEVVFLMCCKNVAVLRTYLTTRRPGYSLPTFREFKENFDLLFTASSNKKELNKDIIEQVKSWLNLRTNETPVDIRKGISLFEEYKTELFKQNILKMG